MTRVVKLLSFQSEQHMIKPSRTIVSEMQLRKCLIKYAAMVASEMQLIKYVK